MVTIWKSFNRLEPLVGCGFVKFLVKIVSQRQPRDMEISVFGPLDPLLERSALDVVLRPIPAILTLNNMELAFDPEGSSRMAGVRSSTVHDDLIEAI